MIKWVDKARHEHTVDYFKIGGSGESGITVKAVKIDKEIITWFDYHSFVIQGMNDSSFNYVNELKEGVRVGFGHIVIGDVYHKGIFSNYFSTFVQMHSKSSLSVKKDHICYICFS